MVTGPTAFSIHIKYGGKPHTLLWYNRTAYEITKNKHRVSKPIRLILGAEMEHLVNTFYVVIALIPLAWYSWKHVLKAAKEWQDDPHVVVEKDGYEYCSCGASHKISEDL